MCCPETVVCLCDDAELPDELVVELPTNPIFCGCAATGGTISIFKEPDSCVWSGSGAFGECENTVTFVLTFTGPTCNDAELEASWSDECMSWTGTPVNNPPFVVCSCDPFSVIFGGADYIACVPSGGSGPCAGFLVRTP